MASSFLLEQQSNVDVATATRFLVDVVQNEENVMLVNKKEEKNTQESVI